MTRLTHLLIGVLCFFISHMPYAQNWNGDLSFGAGWGYSALSRLCANGVGAPCRVKPESVFGG